MLDPDHNGYVSYKELCRAVFPLLEVAHLEDWLALSQEVKRDAAESEGERSPEVSQKASPQISRQFSDPLPAAPRAAATSGGSGGGAHGLRAIGGDVDELETPVATTVVYPCGDEAHASPGRPLARQPSGCGHSRPQMWSEHGGLASSGGSHGHGHGGADHISRQIAQLHSQLQLQQAQMRSLAVQMEAVLAAVNGLKTQ